MNVMSTQDRKDQIRTMFNRLSDRLTNTLADNAKEADCNEDGAFASTQQSSRPCPIIEAGIYTEGDWSGQKEIVSEELFNVWLRTGAPGAAINYHTALDHSIVVVVRSGEVCVQKKDQNTVLRADDSATIYKEEAFGLKCIKESELAFIYFPPAKDPENMLIQHVPVPNNSQDLKYKQISYMSVLSEDAQIEEIVEQSKCSNKKNQITGAMLFDPERRGVAQIIEGPKDVVDALFRKIRHDDRHKNINSVITHCSGKRLYPPGEHAMRFKQVNYRLEDPLETYGHLMNLVAGTIIDDSQKDTSQN